MNEMKVYRVWKNSMSAVGFKPATAEWKAEMHSAPAVGWKVSDYGPISQIKNSEQKNLILFFINEETFLHLQRRVSHFCATVNYL